MSGLHGMFSLGGMAGAVTGGAALAAGMAPNPHLMLVAATMALVDRAAARHAAARPPPPAGAPAFACRAARCCSSACWPRSA